MPRVVRQPRNSVQDRPGRYKLLLRRQRRLLRPAAWALAGLVCVFGVVFLARASATAITSLRDRLGTVTAALGMKVDEVVVEGRANTPEPLLRAAIGVAPGDAMLGFSVAAARTRIETLAWVEHATVERRLPGTIVVALVERRPFAIWQHAGKFVLIDRAGQVVADQDVAHFRDLPLVVGSGAPQAAAVLLDALRDRPAIGSHVTAAVRIAERRWNLHLANGGDVLLPEGAEVAALDRLASLQQDHALLDRPLAAIDLRLPDRLVVRPQADAKPADSKPADSKPGESKPDAPKPDGQRRPT